MIFDQKHKNLVQRMHLKLIDSNVLALLMTTLNKIFMIIVLKSTKQTNQSATTLAKDRDLDLEIMQRTIMKQVSK